MAAWVIELPHGRVLAIFPNDAATHATDESERALTFVNRAEGIEGELVSLAVKWR